MKPETVRALWVGTVGFFVLGALFIAPAGTRATTPVTQPQCSTDLALYDNAPVGPAPLVEQFELISYFTVPVTVSWNFGDGSYFNGSGPSVFDPAHQYDRVGNYLASVAVSATGTGRTGACSAPIELTPPVMFIKSSASTTSGNAPLVVQFSATLVGGTGTFTQLAWNFGDGSTAPGYNLTYTYTRPGVYRAVFTAVDSSGESSNSAVTITVHSATSTTATPGVGTAPLSFFGAVGASLAVLTGAAIYFRDRRRPPVGPSAPDHGEDGPSTALAPMVPGVPAASIAPTSTALATVDTLYPPQMYRGLFLDLSDVEYGELPASGPSAIVPAPSAPISTGRERSDRPRLSQRVLLHLYSLPRIGPDDIPSDQYTQTGMVEALEVPQSLLSNVLRRLTFSGLIRHEVGHIQRGNRRVNVYRLTPKGEHAADKLRRETPSDATEESPDS